MKLFQHYIILFLLLITIACDGQEKQTNEKKSVSAQTIIKNIESGKPVQFYNVFITGVLDFSSLKQQTRESSGTFRSYIDVPLYFENCIFENEVKAFHKDTTGRFHFVQFTKSLVFVKCEFRANADFQEIFVNGITNFYQSVFHKKAMFEGAVFNGAKSYFGEIKFSDDTRFQRVQFNGDADFLKSEFWQNVSFQKSIFRSNIQLGAVKFLQNVDFGLSTIKGDLLMTYAEFSQKANFNYCNIDGRADIISCKFKSGAEWKNTVFKGVTKFNNSTFNGELRLDNSIFFLGKPYTESVIFEGEKKVNLENAKYSSYQQLQISDF